MLFEQQDRFREQQFAEDEVNRIREGLSLLHPLSRRVIVDYLQRQIDRLNEMKD